MDRTDQNRLRQIQQSDLTESRINQDFVDWLRTKGLNWALVILVALCGVMAWNLWKDRQSTQRNEAWIDLASANIPAALQDVAARFPNVDSVAPLALLGSADKYLQSVQTGQRFDRDPTAEDYLLTPELRAEWIEEADRLYARLLDEARARADRADMSAFELSALFGRAAAAESKGDFDAALRFLDEARATAVKADLPVFVTVADEREATMNRVRSAPPLPTRAELPVQAPAQPVDAPVVDQDLLRDLLTPSEPRGNGGADSESGGASGGGDGQPGG